MSTLKKKTLTLLCFLLCLQGLAQKNYSRRLQQINTQICNAWRRGDEAALLSVYADSAVSMPEFHLPLYGKTVIGGYIHEWLDSTKVLTCTRTTHDVYRAGPYLVETGEFNRGFVHRGRQVDYQTKYLALWRDQSRGGLKLISEITGSVRSLNRSDLPLSELRSPDTTQFPKPELNATLRTIRQLNSQIAELVVQAKGSSFAPYYTDDAIYMPYYMPMLIGKAAIDAYYRQHEDPRTGIDVVWIRPSRIIEAKDIIVVDGYYHVDWRSGEARGTVTGKNISVWKRQPGGGLLLFRQMAVHD